MANRGRFPSEELTHELDIIQQHFAERVQQQDAARAQGAGSDGGGGGSSAVLAGWLVANRPPPPAPLQLQPVAQLPPTMAVPSGTAATAIAASDQGGVGDPAPTPAPDSTTNVDRELEIIQQQLDDYLEQVQDTAAARNQGSSSATHSPDRAPAPLSQALPQSQAQRAPGPSETAIDVNNVAAERNLSAAVAAWQEDQRVIGLHQSRRFTNQPHRAATPAESADPPPLHSRTLDGYIDSTEFSQIAAAAASSTGAALDASNINLTLRLLERDLFRHELHLEILDTLLAGENFISNDAASRGYLAFQKRRGSTLEMATTWANNVVAALDRLARDHVHEGVETSEEEDDSSDDTGEEETDEEGGGHSPGSSESSEGGNDDDDDDTTLSSANSSFFVDADEGETDGAGSGGAVSSVISNGAADGGVQHHGSGYTEMRVSPVTSSNEFTPIEYHLWQFPSTAELEVLAWVAGADVPIPMRHSDF